MAVVAAPTSEAMPRIEMLAPLFPETPVVRANRSEGVSREMSSIARMPWASIVSCE
jgi:hypothetical protein